MEIVAKPLDIAFQSQQQTSVIRVLLSLIDAEGVLLNG